MQNVRVWVVVVIAIVPFNIGPKYEFVSNLVQNSPKQEPHSRSNTI